MRVLSIRSIKPSIQVSNYATTLFWDSAANKFGNVRGFDPIESTVINERIELLTDCRKKDSMLAILVLA